MLMILPGCASVVLGNSNTDLPGRRKTGIFVVQIVEQQSVEWFETVILLEKLEPKEIS